MLGFYYPHSHMWGVLFLHYFNEMEIPFCIIHNSNLMKLAQAKVLVVPGGFASEKAKGLGKKGLDIFRDYVGKGGVYLGFCGGAGLGLAHGENTLGICKIKRKPMSMRLPNFSGHVKINLRGLEDIGFIFDKQETYLPVWWPSQFQVESGQGIRIIGTYDSPGEDLWIADIAYSVLKDMDIAEVERVYGINLDFSILRGEPCIICGRYGLGRYILSYAHLETPGSLDANKLLFTLLKKLMNQDFSFKKIRDIDLQTPFLVWGDKILLFTWKKLIELVHIGQENFLFCWRKKWLLGWKRGVIGLSLNSLLCMVWFLLAQEPNDAMSREWNKHQEVFIAIFKDFYEKFKLYLSMQRFFYLKNSPRPPDRFEDLPINRLILELTGPFPGDGGLFKKLVDILEQVIISLYDCA